MPPLKALSAQKGAANPGCHVPDVWWELQGCGCGADADGPVWPSRVVSNSVMGDRHSPEGCEALGAVLGGCGLMFVFHVVEKQSSGWPRAGLWSPAGPV